MSQVRGRPSSEPADHLSHSQSPGPKRWGRSILWRSRLGKVRPTHRACSHDIAYSTCRAKALESPALKESRVESISEEPYLKPYLRAAREHGGSFEALLWATAKSQRARFD